MQRNPRSKGAEPTLGVVMNPNDTVPETLAGVHWDTNGKVIMQDVAGNPRHLGGLVAILTAAGTAVSNTTDETVSAEVVIPAEALQLGSYLEIYFDGIATATNGTDTLVPRLRMGANGLTGTALLAGAAIDVANNSFFAGDFHATVRENDSADSAIVGSGRLSNVGTSSAGTAATAQKLASTDFPTNADLEVAVTLQWSAASASNSARADQLVVKIYK